MQVALFIPCYVNAVFPEVGMASLHLLQQLGVDVVYPERQTCCGQPMGNAGFEDEAAGLARHFEEVFAGYDYVVGPSASCVSFVRDHYGRLLAYIDRGNQDLGYTMVKRGLASAYPYDGPFQRYPRYAKADRQARAAGTGSWSRCDISPG